MSWRLAADKRPNGQTLQSLQCFRDPREPGGPRGNPRTSKCPECKDGPLFASRLSPRPEKIDIRKTLHKNVFIDSYYPVVRGETSETGADSQSSYEETYISTDGPKSESAWEADPGGGHEKPRGPSPVKASSSCHGTLTSVCPTFDSRTYTVHSGSSDMDSAFVEFGQQGKDGAFGVTDDPLASSTVGCFSQLYHRIHNLEDLLQQAIVPGVQPKQSKSTETVEWEKEKPVKKKLSRVQNHSGAKTRNWESNCLSIPEVTDEKTNSDTDSELRNIKKRLKVLEKKLRASKQPLPPSFSLHRIPKGPLSASSEKSKDVDCSLQSETESFLQSEVYLLNSEGDCCEKKTKPKVRKKFISKCRGIRRKCSGLGSSLRKTPLKSSPLKMSTTSGWSELVYQRSILTEESLATTLLNQSFSTQTKTDSSVVYLRCQHEDLLQPPRKPRKKNGKKRKYLCKKSSKTNILSVHCTDAPLLASSPNNPYLFPNPAFPSATTLHICDSDSSLWQPNTPLWKTRPPWTPFHHKCCSPPPHRSPHWTPQPRECTLKPLKLPNKNPIEVLKGGGKVKIPVLFEEVCKTSGSKKLGHKVSNISMRFVVVEEDNEHPLTPLRRLVNKLSQPKPPPRGEQFVFGVSRCGCDDEVQKLRSISHRKVTSGLS